MKIPSPPSLELAPIGNCSIAALVDADARILWSCFPRLDGDPVFCAMMNGLEGGAAPEEDGGFADILIDDFERSEQHYRRNSAVLVTTLHDAHGQAVEIIDFAPRFRHLGRYHRPTTLIRIIRPAAGTPRLKIRMRPRHSYGAGVPETTRGSNHIRYVGPDRALRLTTDAPISYVLEETQFVLEHPLHLIFGADESLTAPIAATAEHFLEQTDAYWREFVRYLALPYEWQDAVIRAAITLKLCSYEETGAIVAALTTSVPEAPHSLRNWDYRFCWLRDAYFVVLALNRLGATQTMESYLHYITDVVASSDNGYLQPLFSISLKANLKEYEVEGLRGYRGMGPVRVGNGAHTQVQNDSYGAVVLASAQAFFDRRLEQPGTESLYERLELLGEQAVQLWNKPDAGLWEFRNREHVHTFSAVMCWAACDRLSKIGGALGLDERAVRWRREADTMRKVILEEAYDKDRGTFVDAFGGNNLDASLLLLHELGFVSPDDPMFLGTVRAVEEHLLFGDHLKRYHAADDFGVPEVAFTVCTFWYVDALAATGRREEARALFERLLAARNRVGVLSEDIDLTDGALWGNFPQTYSMVGLINSAMKLSKSWEEAF
ncbi:glycoside hydrolase family 15 protein [Inquilinus sp. CAU 1745]|uniref:glycoside hydrolase family 15 protein n=1 Tax=Inquilinus sp. CAU 1745 TaxID=3140369 RepID=UPI00325B20BF